MILDGQAANQTNLNNAFASKTAANTLTGVQALNNTSDLDSGAGISNVQRAINETWSADGIVGIGDANAKNYSSNVYVADGDDRKVAIGKLDAALSTVATSLNGKLPTLGAASTDNGLPRWDGIGGNQLQDSGVTVDDSDNMDIPGDLQVHGDLTVTGTTTALGSSTTVDPTITVNLGGNDASSEDAGLLVERNPGDFGSILFENALASKWKCGLQGAEKEIVDVTSTQTLENKSMDVDDGNVFLNIRDSAIAADAAIARTKFGLGSPDYVVINDGTGALSEEQYLDKSRGGTGQDNSGLLFPSTGTVLVQVGPVNRFSFTNNSSGQVVTGLIFDKTIYRSVKVEWTVYRKSTSPTNIRMQSGSFYMIHDDTNWTLTELDRSGAASGVTIDFVAASGQVKIDADDNGGTPGNHFFDFKTVNVFEV